MKPYKVSMFKDKSQWLVEVRTCPDDKLKHLRVCNTQDKASMHLIHFRKLYGK